MPDCKCGRFFRSAQALEQHQSDRARFSNTTPCVGSASPAKKAKGRASLNEARRNAWVRKDVQEKLLIRTIDYDELQPAPAAVTSSGDVELVCSYNWKDRWSPSLYVPGYAPKWKNVQLPTKVSPDSGTFFIDQNAVRSPDYTFWPMFEATALMNKDFRFDNVDIITNRNSLRKLLTFCAGRAQDPFRIELFLVNNTLILERCSRSNIEKVKAADGKYGHSFEKAFTTEHLRADRLTGYHRTIKYPIGDLTCAVRFEVDACYEMEDETEQTMEEREFVQTSSLIVQLGDMQISKPSERQRAIMPQSTAAELKTASKPKRTGEFLTQLWLGRTPWLIMGLHNKGNFESVKIHNMESSFEKWEHEHQDALQKMAALLEKLRDVVREADGHNCVVVCARGPKNTLKIYKSSVKREVLPGQLVDRFWAVPKNETAKAAET